MKLVLIYLVGLSTLLVLIACYAGWLRDRFGEVVFSISAGAVLLLALAGVGVHHDVPQLIRGGIYSMLGIVILLLSDAFVFNRHNDV
jgi:hypothetical protein